MAVRHHTLDVYGVELHLATNRREWATLRRRLDFLDKKAPESLGFAQWATWKPNGPGKVVPHLVLWVHLADHAGDVIELVDTCAHEAAHGASEILGWTGHNKAGDEPHAYLVGWLTRWMFEGCQP